MIPIDLWTAEGRAEMRAHLDLIGEIEEAEAKLDALKAQLPAWLGRRGVEVVVTHAWDCQPLPRLEEAPVASATGAPADPPTAEKPQADPASTAPVEPEPAEIMGERPKPAAELSAESTTPRKLLDLPARDVEAIVRLHAAGVSPLSISIRLKLNLERVNAVIEGLPAQGAAREGRDPERLWTPELKAEAWEMAEEGLGVKDIAVKLAISDHRVRTLLARIRDGKCPAPKLASAPAAAPEAPAEAAPVESPAADDPTDPERWINDAMKAQIWRMDQDGHQPADIAAEMSLAPKRVQNLLYRIKAGKHPVPVMPDDEPEAEAPASTAIATTSTAGALVVPERGIARDPEMVQQWRDDMTEAERRKFVARSEYPEMHP